MAGLQLRIKDASIRVNNRNSTVESLQRIECRLPAHHGSQIESQILRVEIGLEAVGKALLLARGNLNVVLVCSEVSDNARIGLVEGPQASADELHGDRIGFLVHEGEDGLVGLAVGDLNAKDLSVGEGCFDRDGQSRRG